MMSMKLYATIVVSGDMRPASACSFLKVQFLEDLKEEYSCQLLEVVAPKAARRGSS